MDGDFSEAITTEVIANPTPKIGILVRYRSGRKDEAIDTVFEKLGGPHGVVALVRECGLSRAFASPDLFPRENAYVPGHGHKGLMFVRYEVLD